MLIFYLHQCLFYQNSRNVPNILWYSTEFEAVNWWTKFSPFIMERKRCPETWNQKTTVWFQDSPWRRGRSKQQYLPDGPWAQPALALPIHSVFVKQTFNLTSICQMSPVSLHQLAEHCRFFLKFFTITTPKLAAAVCCLWLNSRNKKRKEKNHTDNRHPDGDGLQRTPSKHLLTAKWPVP